MSQPDKNFGIISVLFIHFFLVPEVLPAGPSSGCSVNTTCRPNKLEWDRTRDYGSLHGYLKLHPKAIKTILAQQQAVM